MRNGRGAMAKTRANSVTRDMVGLLGDATRGPPRGGSHDGPGRRPLVTPRRGCPRVGRPVTRPLAGKGRAPDLPSHAGGILGGDYERSAAILSTPVNLLG